MSELIEPRELRARQQAGDRVTVVDVRGAEDYRAGHLPGALHIPADQLQRRMAEIPRDAPVVTY